MSEKKKNAEKKSLFKRKKKNVKYPTRYYINLYKDETKGKNKFALIGFGIFLIFLAAFVKIGVYDQIEKVNRAEKAYNQALSEVMKIREANKEYEEVKALYDEVTDWYMTDDEKKEIDKINVFRMLEEDMMPYVGIKNVQIKGNEILIQTDITTLDTVSKFLEVLQNDERNGFVTVTTASASNNKNQITNDITANVQIVYVGSSGKSPDYNEVTEAELEGMENEQNQELSEELNESENAELSSEGGNEITESEQEEKTEERTE